MDANIKYKGETLELDNGTKGSINGTQIRKSPIKKSKKETPGYADECVRGRPRIKMKFKQRQRKPFFFQGRRQNSPPGTVLRTLGISRRSTEGGAGGNILYGEKQNSSESSSLKERKNGNAGAMLWR